MVAFSALSVIGNVIAGRHCEKAGPRGSLVAGGLVVTAGLLVAGLAPSILGLVLGRAMQGAGFGAASVLVGLGGFAMSAVLTRGGSTDLGLSIILLLAAAVSSVGALMAGRLRLPAHEVRRSSDDPT